MRYLRLFAGPDGESHFEDTDVALAPVEFIPGRPQVDLSAPSTATGTAFIRLPAGWDSGGRYNPPRRNFFVTLSGELEIEASDGQVRHLGPGTVLLAEDTTGKGHVTRCRGGEWVGMLVTPASGDAPEEVSDAIPTNLRHTGRRVTFRGRGSPARDSNSRAREASLQRRGSHGDDRE